MSHLPRCRGRTRCWVCLSFCPPFWVVAVKRTRSSASRSFPKACIVRSQRQPSCYRLLEGIAGGLAAVFQGSDRDVPLGSTSLETRKAKCCLARSKGYHFPCKPFFSSLLYPGRCRRKRPNA